MQTSQLAEIDASLKALVRRAYDLGRDDALKQVVDVLKSDRACSEPLALAGPADAAASMPGPELEDAASVQPESRPWWAWPVR